MALGERLTTLLQTLNPDAYTKLCAQLRLRDTIKQFFFNFFAIFILMLLLLIPGVLIGAPQLEQRMHTFQDSWIDGNFTAAEPIVLISDPKIIVDLSENATLGKEKLLITQGGVEWKRYYFFGKTTREWTDIQNVKDISSGFYTAIILFLAPSIAFWFGIVFILKYLIMAFIFGTLAFFIPKLWRHAISYNNAIKVALYSTTAMMLIEMILFPFYRISWLPIALFFIFLVIGITLVGDRDITPTKKYK